MVCFKGEIRKGFPFFLRRIVDPQSRDYTLLVNSLFFIKMSLMSR